MAGRDPEAGEPDAVATFALLGDPDGGPSLDLDHERFAYAGKFVVSSTGKAVARTAGPSDGADPGDVRAGGDLLAAASFDRDRTDPAVVRIRYVTVRRDRRGEGLGPRLLDFLARRVLGEAGAADAVREVRIAVNNPFAYEAAYRGGFGYTGERTGLAELVLARPGDRSASAYRRGLSAFRERDDLGADARAFLDGRRGAEPPPAVGSPSGEG